MIGKEGLKYFQADVDLYDDKKFILAQHIVDPELKNNTLRFLVPHIAVRMLSLIYENGYFIEWNNDIALSLSALPGIAGGVSLNNFKLLIHSLIECGFFSKEKHSEYGILTSHGIQFRWKFIISRLNRRNCVIKNEYNLLPQVINISKKKIKSSGGLSEESGGEVTKSGGLSEKLTPKTDSLINNNNESIILSTLSLERENKEERENLLLLEESGGEVTKSGGLSEESGGEVTKSGGLSEESGGEVTKSGVYGYGGDFYVISLDMRGLLHPISVCLWNYFNNEDFKPTRDQHFLRLSIHPDPSEAEKLMQNWAQAFNRSLIDKGTTTSSMSRDSNSWLTYFPNWVNSVIGSRGKVDPDVLYTKNDTGKGKKEKSGSLNGVHIANTKEMSEAELQDHFTFKRKK